ncbi:SDR family NAD(P)-dependent oxidoreductase [Aspergillus homomorphus CBS 101889]|uniref:Short chain dehydrogenase/ reductase n=1 Tax=Aspergillus homomorphus (strain CBS 101889) TaxID=1450537 RepID=A0A395HX21_ASPHC|nr:short chain dehydrogenase/ reductase [Aspergillus homomorphus CBS 101889]RAL12340.1 short chain dehydrogenase/ reductase [Aspergillus homomorphus CBS 101889]
MAKWMNAGYNTVYHHTISHHIQRKIQPANTHNRNPEEKKMTFENKVYAITGLAGIGLAVAKHLYARGARLSLADISASALQNAVSILTTESPDPNDNNDRILTTELDITNRAAVDAWITRTTIHFGRLDGAANMAGAIGRKHGVGALLDQDDDEWDMLLRVNMSGTMYCLRAEVRAILATAGTGSIVNAASIQGVRGFALHAAYSATKHGVVGLTRSVAKEVGPAIRVNAVAPGSIQTPLLDKAVEIQGGKLNAMPTVFPRLGTAEEVAESVGFLLSDASSYTTGQVLSVDGGWDP